MFFKIKLQQSLIKDLNFENHKDEYLGILYRAIGEVSSRFEPHLVLIVSIRRNHSGLDFELDPLTQISTYYAYACIK